MIDTALEKEKKFSAQDYFDIINFSMESAEDNGFVNSYVFERSMYVFAAIMAYPDRKDEISSQVAENVLDAFDNLIKDGTIEKMRVDFSTDIMCLENYAETWLKEYKQYTISARGLFTTIQDFSSDIVSQATKQLQEASSNETAQEVMRIAEEWGMNNPLASATE